ncbi:MAG: EamA family transporter [Timaviella obliquedivisa GSE-PSE-MK23-08B]|jgi:drug/metabolite transporter (DMT)-like permease|nr:EamA family transporter [Timaviella obliquedivisa GSE-PSE-MK23-08B]
MGRLENLPKNIESSEGSRSADDLLRTMTQDLQDLQQEVVTHLQQDVRRLQTEKSRLINEIEKLQNQHEAAQSQYEVILSRQQQEQQQVWAKQLALALANHLQVALSQKLRQADPFSDLQVFSDVSPADEGTIASRSPQGIASPQLTAIDDTLNRTFTTLRSDLNSYQSSLSQQIDRMQNMGKQGEAILEVLVRRISQQLQLEMARSQGTQTQLPGEAPMRQNERLSPSPLSKQNLRQRVDQISNHFQIPKHIQRLAAVPQKFSSFQLGLILILLSTVALSLHNVVVGIVGNPSQLFGVLPVGGFISLKSLGSSLLLLWLRMLVVVPLMAFWLATRLYKPVWKDVKTFCLSKDRRLISSVIGSGFFLFLSQVMIYIAIGQVGPGVAITILFMYPLVTVPLAWALFGDRPTSLRVLVMIMISCGIALTTVKATASNWSGTGISAAMVSGVCFALYLLTMQVSFRKLHPIPVSLIQFATIFVLSSLSLIAIGIDTPPSNWAGLIGGSLMLGGLTLVGYLLNNFGVRFMGAAHASIIAASGPALTALLAVIINPGERTFLSLAQIVGILVVTLGVVTLSFEKMLIQQSKPIRQKR